MQRSARREITDESSR
jgi:hypothetical protein